MAYLAIRCMAKAPIPNCEGFIRPITVIAPLGSLVNPTEPAACASRGIIAYRMLDTMFGALAKLPLNGSLLLAKVGRLLTRFRVIIEGADTSPVVVFLVVGEEVSS